MSEKQFDAIIVGGGQSGLAVAYYLRRTGCSFLVLDGESNPGGSWQHYWESIKLFSPAQWSSLPGFLMPGGTEHYPNKKEVLDYFKTYEQKYDLPVERPVRVENVILDNQEFIIQSSGQTYRSKVVVSATGSFQKPWIPAIPGLGVFKGDTLHSADYRDPEIFAGKRVGIVGEGNSGAQILAELSHKSSTYWFTNEKPDFLPDDVDGRYLFNAATQLFEAKKKGKAYIPPSLGHIVMVPSLLQARETGVLDHFSKINRITPKGIINSDGEEVLLDVIIFCTGYRPALDYLKKLPLDLTPYKAKTFNTRSREIPGLWFVGYGSWTGFASATIIGVGRSAKRTSEEVIEFLNQ